MINYNNWEVVENDHVELEKKSQIDRMPRWMCCVQRRTKDKTTLYILYQVVDEFDFEKITSSKSSKEVW